MPEPTFDKNIIESFDPQRPFLGLRSFDEKNKSQFGGRDTEIKDLFNLVDIHGLTIIFGESGIGKTSLLKAGLNPELQKNFYLPMYIRIDFNSDKNPLEQLKEFVYNKIKTYDSNVPDWKPQTLWEFFHSVKILDGLITPVLILDQFEELFTIGYENSRNTFQFIQELSDLAENRVPLCIQEKMNTTNEIMSSNYGARPYRLVISLREDYLAQLESLTNLKSSMRNSRYRVLQLTTNQALDAVLKPGKGLVEEQVAIEIIKKIPGITDQDFQEITTDIENNKRILVEPFLLGLICYQINEKRIALNQKTITTDLVADFKIGDVINNYYNEIIKSFPPHVETGIEESLLTESGYRKLQAEEELRNEYKISNQEINQLITKRIIRKEIRDGVEYVELLHDILVPIIKQKREIRFAEKKKKENELAIETAVNQARERSMVKLKKIRIGVAIFVIFLLTVIAITIYYANISAEQSKRLRLQRYAQNLLTVSKTTLLYNGDKNAAAFISGTAYQIYKENGGEDFNPFYSDLYNIINFSNSNFSKLNDNSIALKALLLHDNKLLVADNAGSLVIFNWPKVSDTLSSYKFPKKITQLKISPDKSKYAVAGVMDSIALFNTTSLNRPIAYFAAPISGNAKQCDFLNDDQLVILSNSSLRKFVIPQKTILDWKPRKIYRFNDGKEATPDITVNFTNNDITFNNADNNSLKLAGLSTLDNTIIVSFDYGLIIIKEDSILEITSEKFETLTLLTVDNINKNIYVGDGKGGIFKISLLNYSVASLILAQAGRPMSIACSSNGKYIAMAGGDGNIGIYDIGNELINNYPIVQYRMYSKGTIPFALCFDESNKFLVSGYNDGKLLIWPTDVVGLVRAVNEITGLNEISNLDTWNKYVTKEFTENLLGYTITNDFLKKYELKHIN
ncbi:MAG: hypothetical protein IPH61_10285 [Bacteroidetes bacterium]|nr:hypothetical protein [Bacteroidota bacterium]